MLVFSYVRLMVLPSLVESLARHKSLKKGGQIEWVPGSFIWCDVHSNVLGTKEVFSYPDKWTLWDIFHHYNGFSLGKKADKEKQQLS